MTIDGMRLPTILDDRSSEQAVAALQSYFAIGVVPAYSGSRFERFAGRGDRPEVADRITAEDLVAVSLLDVYVPGPAALRLLGDCDHDYHRLVCEQLGAIPTDRTLAGADDDLLECAEQLWSLVRANHRMGRAKTSKLLARKRPHLLPVIDSVVVKTVGHVPGRHNFYRNFRAALNARGGRLAAHLDDLRHRSGIGDDISTIRVFDVLVWMQGSGRAASA